MLACFSLGGGCGSPTPIAEPLAGADDALIVFGINNLVCRGESPGQCGGGEEPTCTTVCVEPVDLGETCSPYPCQEDSLCEDRYGSSCVRIDSGSPWPNGTWVCASPSQPESGVYGLTYAAPCEPPPFTGPGALCPTDTYCKDVETCAGVSIGGSEHVCVTYQTHGTMCDTEAGNNGCALCAPGTDCVESDDVDLYPYAWAAGWCLKPCTTDDDCPCEDSGQQKHACIDDYCYTCSGLEGQCGGKFKCCDPDHQCGGYVEGVQLGECCLDLGESCSSNGQCCTMIDQVCFDGVCDECREESESCLNNGQCCDGLQCMNGECREQCVVKPCYELGNPCEGEYECPSGDCVFPSPTAESCDGKDNDCDGLVDEDLNLGVCDAEPFNCADGFEVEVEKVCNQDGEEDCVAHPGVAYCTFNSQIVDGDSCGMPSATPCDGDPPCLPNMYCAGPPGFEECVPNPGCTYPGIVPKCWMPEDAGTCMDPS